MVCSAAKQSIQIVLKVLHSVPKIQNQCDVNSQPYSCEHACGSLDSAASKETYAAFWLGFASRISSVSLSLIGLFPSFPLSAEATAAIAASTAPMTNAS